MVIKELAFSSRTALNFPYVCSSLLVADVDSDGVVEIIAGSRDGQLAIFKPDGVNNNSSNGQGQQGQAQGQPAQNQQGQPYRTASKLGFITALAVGDLFNRKQTVLTVISVDGACHVFWISSTRQEALLCLTQPLQSNIRCAQIIDVDGDYYQELVVALTDRVVRTYRYMANNNSTETDGRLVALNKWESPALITAFSSSFTDPQPYSGIRVILSQTRQKFVVLEPKLGLEHEMAGDSNTVDRSVRYSQAERPASATAAATANTTSTPLDESTIFLAKNAEVAYLFHMPAARILLVNDEAENVEVNVELPQPVFAIASSIFLDPTSNISPNQSQDDSSTLPGPGRVFLACDWHGDVFLFHCGDKKQVKSEDMYQLRMQCGVVNCFTASHGKTELHQCVPKYILAASTTQGRLYVYTLTWSKVQKAFS